MGKVIKIFLNNGFTPINNSVFKLGTSIGFDCYIQRFNGFVILIEKGTFLNQKIYNKITRNHLPIYVDNMSYQLYKHYAIQHQDLGKETLKEKCNFDEALHNILNIHKVTANEETAHKKLEVIYIRSKCILNAWIVQKKQQTLPLEALDGLVEHLVDIVNKESITLSTFHDFIDEKECLAAHLVKVAFFASIVGTNIGLDFVDQKKLLLSAILHDIGKCDLDESLLNKPDMLNNREFEIIKIHAEASASLVRKSGLNDRIILAAIRGHHERLDGSGYPSGLVGSRISQFAQILAVCDMFDALITLKPYRGAYTTYNALNLMRIEGRNKLRMEYINLLIQHSK